jgi:tetratricopeptide (TPR) repeat protein
VNKRKIATQLEQARLHSTRGEWDAVERLVRPLFDAKVKDVLLFTLLGESLRQLGRREEARTVLEQSLTQHPQDAELEARLGCVLLDLDEAERAIEFFKRAKSRLTRDPQLLTSFAAALLRTGRAEEAEAQLARALLVGGGADTRLVLAIVKSRRGQFDEAERIAAQVEAVGAPALVWQARALRADLKIVRGDSAGSLELWKSIEAAGRLEPYQLANMAWAAALAGESSLADSLMDRRLAQTPTGPDLLLFAQIANLRKQPARAIDLLESAERLVLTQEQGWRFDTLSTRGRSLRLLDRKVEARAALLEAIAEPESQLARVGASPFIDLGHLEADAGDFEQAEAHFRRALSLDPDEPEARRALELTARRLGWRQALEASADERVGAAQAEAEALRRRYVARDSEVERLKREVERLKAERGSARQEVREVTAQADAERRRLEDESKTRVRLEIEQRELEIEARSLENLERVFGAGRDACPERLWQMLLVAERTYQKALYTELPAAAVAVLFSGAFERSLVELIAQDFDRWLDQRNLRTRFLEAGVRERRGSRVEYFDRFFESLDRELEARPPSLGEISRVLERRNERYLAIFDEFLTTRFSVPPAFWDAFARFVTWGKETLRDPVAHGHIEIDWEGLKQFRERLLFTFDGDSPGALPRLMKARKR